MDNIQILIRLLMKTLAGWLIAHAIADQATADAAANGLGAAVLLAISYGWSHWHLGNNDKPNSGGTGLSMITPLFLLPLVLAGSAHAAMSLPGQRPPVLGGGLSSESFNNLTVNTLTVRSNSSFGNVGTNATLVSLVTSNATVKNLTATNINLPSGPLTFARQRIVAGTNLIATLAGEVQIAAGTTTTNVVFASPLPPGTSYALSLCIVENGYVDNSAYVYPSAKTTNGFYMFISKNAGGVYVDWIAIPTP